MFADPGTLIFKQINLLYPSLPTLLEETKDKFVPYDQLPKPWNDLDLINKISDQNPKVLEIKKVELDEDDILHTVKLNEEGLLQKLEETLKKIAENRNLIGKYASDPNYSAIQILKEFIPAETTKLLADKLGIKLIKPKVEKPENSENAENIENQEPAKKKVKTETKKTSKTEKELAKIDKKGMKKMTSFFKVVSKKK